VPGALDVELGARVVEVHCGRLDELEQCAFGVFLVLARWDQHPDRAEELAAGLPHTELAILDPAGHQVHSEQFATVVDLVQRFIQRVESSRSG
jgi:pimeloyl-ACP methyl ester carboxylesterase